MDEWTSVLFIYKALLMGGDNLLIIGWLPYLATRKNYTNEIECTVDFYYSSQFHIATSLNLQ